jgi:hypothetical protein
LLVGVGDFPADLSGSSALEASWEARLLSGLCVAPLRLGGLRGKQSTPSVWLGGTGESSTVGKQEQERQEHRNHLLQAIRAQVCHSNLGVINLWAFLSCCVCL